MHPTCQGEKKTKVVACSGFPCSLSQRIDPHSLGGGGVLLNLKNSKSPPTLKCQDDTKRRCLCSVGRKQAATFKIKHSHFETFPPASPFASSEGCIHKVKSDNTREISNETRSFQENLNKIFSKYYTRGRLFVLFQFPVNYGQIKELISYLLICEWFKKCHKPWDNYNPRLSQ